MLTYLAKGTNTLMKFVKIFSLLVGMAILGSCGSAQHVLNTPTGNSPSIEGANPKYPTPIKPRSYAATNLYVADAGGGEVTVYAPGSTSVLRTITAGGVAHPVGVAFSPGGVLAVLNQGFTYGLDESVTFYDQGSTILKAKTTADIANAYAEAFNAYDHLFVANHHTNAISIYKTDGTEILPEITNGVYKPVAVAFDSQGNLYVGNWNTVTVYNPGSGTLLRTISSLGGPVSALYVGASDNLYVAAGANVLEFPPGSSTPSRTISTGVPVAMAVNSGSGNLFVCDAPYQQTGDVKVYAPGATSPLRTITDGINYPVALAFDASNNLYIANYTRGYTGYGPGSVTVYAGGSSSVMETITSGVNHPSALAFGP